MEVPNYVIKTSEALWVPKDDKVSGIRKIIFITIGVMIVASILFQVNIFMEMSFQVRIIYIGLILWALANGGSVRMPSEMEIQFYDDYLIIYNEKKYYSKKLSRKCIDKIYYKDVKQCQYRISKKRINIYGIVEKIRYDYRKDGTISEEPDVKHVVDGGCFFYTALSNVDFVKEIEEHSPLKVEVTEV